MSVPLRCAVHKARAEEPRPVGRLRFGRIARARFLAAQVRAHRIIGRERVQPKRDGLPAARGEVPATRAQMYIQRVYICMYICMHVYTYVCTYVSIYVRR
jgi:hypothetical protein